MSLVLNGTTQYLTLGSAIAAAMPVSFAIWYKPDSVTGTRTLVSLKNSASGAALNCLVLDVNGNAARVVAGDGATSSVATVAGTVSTGAWQHFAGRFDSITSRRVCFQGTSGTASTTSRTPTGFNNTSIGARIDSGVAANFASGKIAYLTIWSIALSTTEMADLATGVNPTTIQPASIIAHLPLATSLADDEGNTWTNNNAATFDGADNPSVNSPPVVTLAESSVSVASASGGTPAQDTLLFDGVTVTDADANNLTATLVFAAPATANLTGTLPTGWTESPAGTFTRTSTTAAQFQTDLQALVVRGATVGNTTATLTTNDGTTNDVDAVTVNVVAPDLSVSVADGGSYDFGAIAADDAAESEQFTLENSGDASLTLGTLSVSGGFAIDAGDDPSGDSIAAGATGTVTVNANFGTNGAKAGVLTIPSNDADSPYVIHLTATVTGGVDARRRKDSFVTAKAVRRLLKSVRNGIRKRQRNRRRRR